MSRCSIKPKADKPNIAEVVVGLDKPLGSWFFQTFDSDGNVILNEWCNRSRAVELIEEYGDLTNLYTSQVRKAIVSDLCPQEHYGLEQASSWDTAEVQNEG